MDTTTSQVANFTALYMKAYAQWKEGESLLDSFKRVAFETPAIDDTQKEVENDNVVVEEEEEKTTELSAVAEGEEPSDILEVETEMEAETPASPVAKISKVSANVSHSTISLGDDGKGRYEDSVGKRVKRKKSKSIVAPPGGRSSIEFGEYGATSEATPRQTGRAQTPGGKSSFQFSYKEDDQPKQKRSSTRVIQNAGGDSNLTLATVATPTKVVRNSARPSPGGASSFQFAYKDATKSPANPNRMTPGGKASIVFGDEDKPREPEKKSEKKGLDKELMKQLSEKIYAQGTKLKVAFQDFLGGASTTKYITLDAFKNGLKNIKFETSDEEATRIFEVYAKEDGINYSSFVRMLSY